MLLVKSLAVLLTLCPVSLYAGMESSRHLPRLEAASRQFFLAGSASHGLASVWKVAPCLGLVISQLKRASAHGAQVQV